MWPSQLCGAGLGNRLLRRSKRGSNATSPIEPKPPKEAHEPHDVFPRVAAGLTIIDRTIGRRFGLHLPIPSTSAFLATGTRNPSHDQAVRAGEAMVMWRSSSREG